MGEHLQAVELEAPVAVAVAPAALMPVAVVVALADLFSVAADAVSAVGVAVMVIVTSAQGVELVVESTLAVELEAVFEAAATEATVELEVLAPEAAKNIVSSFEYQRRIYYLPADPPDATAASISAALASG